MNLGFAFAAAAMIAAAPAYAAGTTLDQMPPRLETRFALSALPPAMRDKATVYLLDPKTGYRLSREGTSGVACLVQRTQWELADFRNDIYYAVCYDAAGAETYLKYVRDAAALRAQGLGPEALKAEIEKRYRDRTYKVPEKPGLSYMIGPVMRTIGPPDLEVHTMAMPHLMFYAPFLTNADIGALPDLANPASLQSPFIDRQGNGEQSYMIQMVGAAEKARILADEKELVDELCAYRNVLCLDHTQH
ncbi:hypothetical protein [Taklimakanibacter lacteus]|uniref:hypothetical protein n=1 Tax=Taklimakanibacter lacteus TaxID=2268456 RepID=UPI0013C46364